MIRPTIDAAIAFVLIVVAFFAAQALAPPIAADDTIPPPVYRVQVPTTEAVTATTVGDGLSRPPSTVLLLGAGSPASVVAPAVRGVARQVTDTVPAPPRLPVDGDCESWRPLLAEYGIPYDEARPRMIRESGCSMAFNFNDATADASVGPLQVNRYGSLARWWDSGGYTLAVMSTPEGAVAAAAVLYHSCGWAPWSPPYGCDGDYLQVPAPAWGQWA